MIYTSWFTDLFINEAKKALDRHSGTGGGESLPSTIILEDESGNQIAAMLTDEVVHLTADKDTDIREGTTAITGEGVVTGGKDIPGYYISEGVRKILNGREFSIPLREGRYNYTALQALICPYNTSYDDSVSTDRVAINTNVYPVNSTESISKITKNDEGESIDFGLMNDSGVPYVIRYFTYKEEY